MKYLAIVNGVSFYTSKAAMLRGVGNMISVNTAIRNAAKLMFKEKLGGFGTSITVYDHNLHSVKIDVNISEVLQ